MELTDELIVINQQFENMLINEMLLYRIAYALLCIACVFFIITALYKLINQRWNSTFFIILCSLVFLWSLLSLLALFSTDREHAELLNTIRYISIIPIPAFLTLHIKLQVSHKELHPYTIALYLLAPIFFILITLRDLFFPNVLSVLPLIADTYLYLCAFYIFAAIAMINSFLLCFNVFFQMPPRTRRSTKSILVSVIALMLLLTVNAVFRDYISILAQQSAVAHMLLPLITPIAFAFIVYPLFDSMYIMPASDVIITSREFIMKGLSTTVLVLNRKFQILDWNRKDWDRSFPLPKPKYKETYPAYLQRTLSKYAGRVSSQNSDIIIIAREGNELHFLVRTHEVRYNKKMFGYVVEISDVTNIYSRLREFEKIANLDMLTGLYNRNAYIAYTQHIIKDENLPLLILVGDLNELKRINDIYGHIVGDEIIKAAANVVNETKPKDAFVARIGGDEFVVIVPNGSAEQAEEFINKANAMCGAIQDEKTTKPSISWGYALMTSLEQSYNDVFEEADKMMYEYKRSRYEFTSSGILPKDTPDT